MTPYSIQATISAWLLDNSSYPVVMNMPENGLEVSHTSPIYSAFHFLVDAREMWMGNVVGTNLHGREFRGILEVSAWVTRKNNSTFMQDLRKASSDLVTMVMASPKIPVDNYEGITMVPYDRQPADSRRHVYLGDIESEGAAQDNENPNLIRCRHLIRYVGEVNNG